MTSRRTVDPVTNGHAAHPDPTGALGVLGWRSNNFPEREGQTCDARSPVRRSPTSSSAPARHRSGSPGAAVWQGLASVPDPVLRSDFRNTTFDNRGIGQTSCDEPMPWPLAKFSDDAAALIEATCEPPVTLVGCRSAAPSCSRSRSTHPHLVRSAIVMGTGARSVGWGWDYQKAEIDLRREAEARRHVRGDPLCRDAVPGQGARRSRLVAETCATSLNEWLDTTTTRSRSYRSGSRVLLYDQMDRTPECRCPDARDGVQRGRAGTARRR